MQTASQNIPLTTAEGFEAFLATRSEPDWLTERRRAAFEKYQELCQVELDPEEFRRLDLRIFRPTDYHLTAEAGQADSVNQFKTLMKDRGDFGGLVTHVDGHPVMSEVSDDLAKEGIVYCSLSDAIKNHEELVKKHLLTRAVDPHADRFSAWHAAFFTGGVFLYVPRNKQLKQPLHSLIGLSETSRADFTHTLVVVEDGGEATLLEETASAQPNQSGMHCGAIELLVGAEARLRYVQLQNWNERIFHFAHQCGRVERNGSLQWTVGALGSKFSHIHQDVLLDGSGSEAEVNGVAFATERQKLSFYTKQAHKAPHTRSDLLYKEVVRDRARVIWRGMIEVDEVAQLTDGYQRNDSLMLSPDARVDAIPGLEINADDVRCTHAATAGQVDEEQILYCTSRGISRTEAMHIIVKGFFHQVFDRIPVEIVRETLSQTVEAKLGFGDSE